MLVASRPVISNGSYMHFRGEIDPFVQDLVEPLFPFLLDALLALSTPTAVAVVLEEACEQDPVTALIGPLRRLKIGHHVGAIPFDRACVLVAALAPDFLFLLERPVSADESWCIAITEEAVTLAPIRWYVGLRCSGRPSVLRSRAISPPLQLVRVAVYQA